MKKEKELITTLADLRPVVITITPQEAQDGSMEMARVTRNGPDFSWSYATHGMRNELS